MRSFVVAGNQPENMSHFRAVCRPHAVVLFMDCCYRTTVKVSSVEAFNGSLKPVSLSSSVFSYSFHRLGELIKYKARGKLNRQRRMAATMASDWTDSKSPYDTLELERDADQEQIKVAYRRLAKFYHPDVYDGRGTLDEGETAEVRFIKVQAAYELLIDKERRRQYDIANLVNPTKASQAWMEWLIKRRKAFDQRGDMAVTTWAEQQQHELNIRAHRLAHSKIDPMEGRKIVEKEKRASEEYCHITLRRHALVLRKRDLIRKKDEQVKRQIVGQLLAAEGLELEKDEDA